VGVFNDALAHLVAHACAAHDRKVRIVWTHDTDAALDRAWLVEVRSPSGKLLGGPWTSCSGIGALTLAADHYTPKPEGEG
jgi:hypothetical protein